VSSSIEGAIIRNAVFDWTHVATSRAPSPPPKSTDGPALISTGPDVWDINTLHVLKTHLFPSPANAFDPFTSPLLFFRSSGLSIPPYFPGTTPSSLSPAFHDPALLDGLSLSDEELASLRTSAPSSSRSTPQDDSYDEATVSRRSALRFPPKGSGLRIPTSLLLTTSAPGAGVRAAPKERGRAKVSQNPSEEMRRQAEEMAKVMRRSLVMYEFKDQTLRDEDGDPQALSEERVQVHELRAEKSEQEEAEVVERWVTELGLL
jgi:hypothetical protein